MRVTVLLGFAAEGTAVVDPDGRFISRDPEVVADFAIAGRGRLVGEFYEIEVEVTGTRKGCPPAYGDQGDPGEAYGIEEIKVEGAGRLGPVLGRLYFDRFARELLR